MTWNQIGFAVVQNLRNWTIWELARAVDLLFLGWLCYMIFSSKDCPDEAKEGQYIWAIAGSAVLLAVFGIDYRQKPDDIKPELGVFWFPIQNLFFAETPIPAAMYKYVLVFIYLFFRLYKLGQQECLGRCRLIDQDAIARREAEAEALRTREALIEAGHREALAIEKRKNEELRTVLARFADTFDLEQLAASEQNILTRFVRFSNKIDPLRRQPNADVVAQFRRHLLGSMSHNEQRALVSDLRRSRNPIVRQIVDSVPHLMLE